MLHSTEFRNPGDSVRNRPAQPRRSVSAVRDAAEQDLTVAVPTPHDALFRSLLSDPERARDFLRRHLPAGVSGLLADAPPEIVDGSFVDEALAASQSDVLLKVRLASGGDAAVYILCEHKSTPDPGLPLQLASYMLRIWKRFAGASAARLRALPPVIPVVVYHGEAAWSVPAGLREMIAADDPGLAFLPGESYILRNLRAMEIDDLAHDAALRAGFLAMRREAFSRTAEVMAGLYGGGDLTRQILEYILRVYDDDMDTLRTLLRNEGQNELEELMGTIAETLLKQGEALGIKKGEALGIKKGEALGKAGTLTRLLERRFGPLPRDVRARIGSAGLPQIEAWFDAAINAPDLSAVFAGQASR